VLRLLYFVKMRNPITRLLMLFGIGMLTIQSLACDICGGFMGITPYDNQSSLCLMHRYRIYNGYRLYNQQSHFFPAGAYQKTMHGGNTDGHDSILKRAYSSKDYESYTVYELRAKYFIHRRIELNVFMPLLNTRSKTDTLRTNHTGLGDPTLFAGYHLLRPDAEASWKQRLIVGAGVKLPLGNYYAHDQYSNRIPLLLQPGTGSTDGFAYLTYVLSYQKIGLSLNSNFKLNGSNKYHERIGNSSSNFVNVFFRHTFHDWTLIPSVQGYYEYTKGLYEKGKLQEGTEMNALLIGPGLDIFYKNFSLNLGLQFNAWEHTSPDNLKNAGRMVIGLCYNFKQGKYLLK